MFTRIADFARSWQHMSADTLKLFQSLTDKSLSQAIGPGHRTVGRLAWHITTSIPEMMNQTGVNLSKVLPNDPVPANADSIRKLYDLVSKELLTKIQNTWSDKDLETVDNMYGMEWKRGETLMILMLHEAHHRGQLTVLMRQAGLIVTGVFGPAREEWADMGMQPPVI